MVKRGLLVVGLLWLAALTVNAVAGRAVNGPSTGHVPRQLHVGDRGKRVKAIQWLLSGHKPSVFRQRKVFVTYTGPVDGRYGQRTAVAVRNMKLRLGYKSSQANTSAGVMLFQLLLGKQRRTPAMVARASFRLREIAAAQARLLKIRRTCSYRELSYARSQLGVTEIPWGSNRGPHISYQVGPLPAYESITGAYGAPWCASFVQWMLYTSKTGTIADRSAGVYYIKDWAWRRALLRAMPRPGDLVAFLENNGHIGVVEAVSRYGITSIEGNTGNAVHRRFHPWHSTSMVFIAVPGCGT